MAVIFTALTAVSALMTVIDFTLSNARRFHSSMGNPLAVKGLKNQFLVVRYEFSGHLFALIGKAIIFALFFASLKFPR